MILKPTMTHDSIITKINQRFWDTNSMAGVGLDPVLSKLPLYDLDPQGKMDESQLIYTFCKRIIESTHNYTIDYKVNANFFQNWHARQAMEQVFTLLRTEYPQVIRICDGKFADVGHTAEILCEYIFDRLQADAVLLNPYLGYDALAPFLERPDKAVILCLNTSNPSANGVQNLALENGLVLWRHLLETAMTRWNHNHNIIPVVSATHPENLHNLRSLIGDTPIVLAGIGSQGGDLQQAVRQTLSSSGYGVMISSSRSILYPDLKPHESHFAGVERSIQTLRNSINQAKSSVNH